MIEKLTCSCRYPEKDQALAWEGMLTDNHLQ